MKTPDEIKQYAQMWREVLVDDCIDFPHATHTMLHTAADVVESLLAEIEKVKRERDAAVEDMTELMSGSEHCTFCKYLAENNECTRPNLKAPTMCWEWRGVQEGKKDG